MTYEVDLGEHKDPIVVKFDGDIDKFPKYLKYKGVRYEMVMYDRGVNVDWKVFFGEIPAFDPCFWNEFTDLEQLTSVGKNACQCGAAHTSFQNFHMYYCPMWRKP